MCLNGGCCFVFVPLDEVAREDNEPSPAALYSYSRIHPLALLRKLDSMKERFVQFQGDMSAPETLLTIEKANKK